MTHELAQVRLARTLAAIAETDPSRHGHTGPDTDFTTALYERRNILIWSALALARECAVPAGVGYEPTDPCPVVVYLDLPTGQVSWHLPAYSRTWDGHTTVEKYQRVAAFVDTVTGPTGATETAAAGARAVPGGVFSGAAPSEWGALRELFASGAPLPAEIMLAGGSRITLFLDEAHSVVNGELSARIDELVREARRSS
ncbi:MAG: hypothetical protein V7603_5116 [Micromonosporaceae bacterium]